MMLFVMLYKVNLTVESVDETLNFVTIQLKATSGAELSCDAVCYALQGESNC